MADVTVVGVTGGMALAGLPPTLPGDGLLIQAHSGRMRLALEYSSSAGIDALVDSSKGTASLAVGTHLIGAGALIGGKSGGSSLAVIGPVIKGDARVTGMPGAIALAVAGPYVAATSWMDSPEVTHVYDIGDSVRLTAVFAVSNVTTDPTAVVLKVQDPGGNEATYTYALDQVQKSGTGAYYYNLTIDEAGTWFYRWQGTGAVVAASEDYFDVRVSEFV